MPERKLRVFLCHTSVDKPRVREIYQRLANEAWIDPWLDEEELLPGQDWSEEIEKAIEKSDAVLVFLSNNSVSKKGYVQKELEFALNRTLESPEHLVNIIPLRLDDVQPPDSLRSFQWMDYPSTEKETYYERLLKSLKERASSLSIDTESASNVNKTKHSVSLSLDGSFENVDKEALVKTLADFLGVEIGSIQILKLAGDSTTDAPPPPKKDK